MEVDAVVVIVVLVAVLFALVRELAAPPAVMLGGLVVLVVLGVLPPERAFVGFSSPATISIAGLFVVAQAVRDHLGLDRVLASVLGDGRRGARPALARLLPPIALLSSVVNNTPLVATSAPIIHRWAQRHGVASSRLLVPVSFAAILGGTVTMIGTSTNLVVSGVLVAAGQPPLGFFTLAPAALPLAVVGVGLLVVLAPRLLPARCGRADHAYEGEVALVRRDEHVRRAMAAGDTRALEEVVDRPASATSALAASMPPERQSHRTVTLATLLGMVGLAATGQVPTVTAVLVACSVLVITGATSFRRAVSAIDLDVLLIVATAIGLGAAVEGSGLAGSLADAIHQLAADRHALVGLAVLVVGTLVLTELITNVAAAALIVPIAVDLAEQVGADPTGYAVAVALAASASFLTPIGYQTNTIVYGLGGYRFGDFWRLGLPLTLTVVTVTLLVVPRVWG